MVTTGSAAVGAIFHDAAGPALPARRNIERCTPATAFALRTNWRRLPWIVLELAPPSSSPSRVVAIVAKENPKSTFLPSVPGVAIATCSLVLSAVGTSETFRLLPPKQGPGAIRVEVPETPSSQRAPAAP